MNEREILFQVRMASKQRVKQSHRLVRRWSSNSGHPGRENTTSPSTFSQVTFLFAVLAIFTEDWYDNWLKQPV